MSQKPFRNHAVGIDLGSSRFIIAIVSKGGVEIITNEANYRQTPCLISYGSTREMGDSAHAKIKNNLKNSIFYPTRYLQTFTNEEFSFEKTFNYCNTKLQNNKPIFNVLYDSERVDLTPEQVTASLFTKILQILKQNHIESNDFVVSVPSYFTASERQGVLDSAQIAGIKLLRVYNESSANVMNYGIFRKGDLSDTEERLVAFVDFGFSKSSVFIAKIWKNKAEIIYEKNERFLGVKNMDFQLKNYYRNIFQQKNKVDLAENPKSIFRLMESIEKQRKDLSQMEFSTLNIECIFEDIDLHETITKENFEQITSEVIQNFSNFLKNALQEAKNQQIDLSKLHSVERVGGGTRIPIIEQIIQQSFQIENVSKTLDASESISRGCAIQSAILSPRYHVQPFVITEMSHYPIKLKLAYEGDENFIDKLLFKQGTEYNKIFSLSIKKEAILQFELSEVVFNQEISIMKGEVEKMKPKEQNFEGKISFELNRNGLVNVKETEMIEKITYEEKIPKKKEEKKDQEKKDQEKKEENKMEIEEEFEIKQKTKSISTPLKSQIVIPYGLNQKEVNDKIQIEIQIQNKESIEKDTANIKYQLESFIYQTREKISQQQNLIYNTPEERENTYQILSHTEHWIYNEGVNVSKEIYKEKHKELLEASKGFYSRSSKILNIKNFLSQALPATLNFEQNNEQLLKLASDLEKSEVQHKLMEIQDQLKQMDQVEKNYSIALCDAYDYESARKNINDKHGNLNNILNEIKKRKEQKEKEEKELKQKEEQEKKQKEQDEKKQKEQDEKQKKEQDEKLKKEAENKNSQEQNPKVEKTS